MARPSKPFFRKQTKSWYCSIDGRQISLGKDKQAAHSKFHELMANRELVIGETTTLYELSQVYLDWCETNRKPGTYIRHKGKLKSFIEHVGKQLRANHLKAHHVTKWLDSLTVSSTTKNDAVAVLQRMLNWCVEQQYLMRNAIKGFKKPKAHRRDIFYTAEQWTEIKKHATGPIGDFLDFLFLTGCRPQEARELEAKHVHDDVIIFSIEESKGGQDARVIFLVPKAKAIVDRLVKLNSDGPLFRNSKGRPWTKDSIKCRLGRITKQVGFRVIAYGARHSFATNALMNNVDSISVAHLMGHKDTTMVSRVYSHIARNPEYLKQQAIKAIGKETEGRNKAG